jgi:hypothetical protein
MSRKLKVIIDDNVFLSPDGEEVHDYKPLADNDNKTYEEFKDSEQVRE